MGHNLKVKTDAYLLHALADLSRITGKVEADDVLAEAIEQTAIALQKTTEGYVIQIIERSIGQDKFSYPLVPQHIYQDMKQRKSAPQSRIIPLSCTTATTNALNLICRTLKTSDLQEAAQFSLTFAHLVATELRKTSHPAHLAYVDSDDRRFGIVAKTPYDRSLRNDFNRMLNDLQDWWKIRFNPAADGNIPPNQPPPPVI